MSPARRSRRRQEWPRGLYEPRPNYFVWRHPDGTTMAIGRVPLAVARNEAIAANHHVAGQQPGLVERLTGADNTVATLLTFMAPAKAKNTEKAWRSLDKKITAVLGTKRCNALTVADCAELLEGEAAAGRMRSAQALRTRLIAVCKRGMQKGWMESNPAEVTAEVDVEVQRGRLTLESFQAIYAKAPEVAEWLPQAMRLAIVTGADRSTIAALQRKDVVDGCLMLARVKTGALVAVPLALRLDRLGLALADVVANRTGVVSKHLVHHVNPWGNAPAGSPVHPDRISHAFTAARKLAGIPDEAAPTFHEIRSLAKRLYDQQGNVDTKALLGHKTERMSDLYADPRGVEPIRVNVNAK